MNNRNNVASLGTAFDVGNLGCSGCSYLTPKIDRETR